MNWNSDPYADDAKELGLAKLIALEAHDGQYRWDGTTPHFTHVQGVVDRLLYIEDKTLGYLHDVREDNPSWDNPRLRKRGISSIQLVRLDKLTMRPGEEYLHYIERVILNQHSAAVKLADLMYNFHDLDRKNGRNRQRAQKYQMAAYIVNSSQPFAYKRLNLEKYQDEYNALLCRKS